MNTGGGKKKDAGLEEDMIGWCYICPWLPSFCFYSNKWHSLYSRGQLDSLTHDENKYCMCKTLSCHPGREKNIKKRWRNPCGVLPRYTLPALVTIVTFWWLPPLGTSPLIFSRPVSCCEWQLWIPHIENYFRWCRIYSFLGLLFEFEMFCCFVSHKRPFNKKKLGGDFFLLFFSGFHPPCANI